jgi:hypothetical protein
MVSRSGRVNLTSGLTVLSIYLDAFFSIPLKLALTLGMGVKETFHRILDEVLKHGP